MLGPKRDDGGSGRDRSGASPAARIDAAVRGRAQASRRIEIETVRQPTAGAIAGLNEAFRAPGQTGFAELTIPFETTPARGLEPELTLRYDSSGGNGVFGQGADLPLSSVSLAINRQSPKYDGADPFALDGEELVPIPGPAEPRMAGGNAFGVTLYRPRRESAFARIERWRPENGGASFWRVISREDEIAVYGASPECRIADPDDPQRVFQWLIESRADPRGNAIRYRYKAEDGVGLPVPELGRRYGANRYPERISYGNARPFVAADPLDPPNGPFLFEVVFDYGEYSIAPDNDTPLTPVRPWSARPDPFSSYVAGFERRTCRLCRHILMVHRFPAKLGADQALVRVMALAYDESPYASRLVSIGVEGWRHVAARESGRRYLVKRAPPVRLGWTALPATPPEFAPLTLAPDAALPRFGAPPPYALLDLEGDGLPGVLYADGATVAYVAPELASADLDAPLVYRRAPLPDFPLPRIASGEAALVDLDGDGRVALSVAGGGIEGYYPPSDETAGWASFRPFPGALADRDGEPAFHVDLTGDGRADRLRIDTETLTYNRNLGRGGFAPAERRARPAGAPLTAPSPPGEDVRFVDALGGGASPAVLLRSGSLRCWPNLGYGRFGAPVDLPAPLWPNSVGPDRVLLADLTGSGCADIVIALSDRLLVHRNRAGNGFAEEPITIPLPRPLRSLDQLDFADMTGMGAQSIVFTSDDPAPRHFVCDFAGGRPGLLARIDDRRGRVVALEYRSSARFQLLDRLEGRNWITTLASPTPVVSRVEEIDEVAGVARVIEYRYSHGYFDAVEREYRGFGLVEARERDTPRPGFAQSAGDAPALLRREWRHTGALLPTETLEEAFAREYWNGDPLAYPMPPSCFEWGAAAVDGESWREAVGALAGVLLRREELAADEPGAPFVAEAANALVRLEQPRIAGERASFLVAPREQIRSVYDRVAEDPSIEHDAALEIDALGEIALAASVAYARRTGQSDIIPEQREIWIEAERSETLPPRSGPDLWLAGLPSQDRRWSLPQPPSPTIRGLYYDFAALLAAVRAAIAPGGGAILIEASRFVYLGDDGGAAPPEAPAPQALLLRDETAAFDAKLLAEQFRDAEPPEGLDAFLAARGYQFDAAEGLWWNPGPTSIHGGAEIFYLPVEIRDPFAARGDARSGLVTHYRYDPHHLLLTGVTSVGVQGDVLPQTTEALFIDYSAMAATRVRNANQRIDEVLLDPLGEVIATSFRGYEWRDDAPVEIGFAPLPLDDPSLWLQPPDAAALLADPGRYLREAASFHYSDWDSWNRGDGPTHVVSLEAQAYPGAGGALPQTRILYVDGFGRELQSKTRAEPGAAFTSDGRANDAAAERWTTSGGRHYNGLGLPDREYEPYFTDHWAYTSDERLNRLGAATTLHYDAIGRLVRTDHPKGDLPDAFFSKIVRRPWSQADWDQDDTIKSSSYYRRYVHPGGGGSLPPLEREALIAAAAFDGTPRISHLDPRGRIVRVEELLTASAEAATTPLTSVIAYDAAGNRIGEADPRQAAAGRWNFRFFHGLDGQLVRTDGADAGTRWSLLDVDDAPAYARDARGVRIVFDVDSHSRPVTTSVLAPEAPEPLVAERFLYGDSLDAEGKTPIEAPDCRNLLGALCIAFDGAGRRDVIGRALTAEEPTGLVTRLARDATMVPDWHAGDLPSWKALFEALAPLLETEAFPEARRYDALGRPIERIDPSGLRTEWRYRRDGLIAAIHAARPGEEAEPYLAATDYNAKEQTLFEVLGGGENGVARTDYRYDPDNFRLIGISSTRPRDGAKLQELVYWSDPVGNVTAVTDAAAPEQRVFHANQDVTPDQRFTYDSLYRLIANDGRARAGYTAAMAAAGDYAAFFGRSSQRSDPLALERYSMRYDHDASGNLWRTRYSAASSSWTQTLTIAEDSNRGAVTETGLGGLFDAAGNQLALAGGGGAPALRWSWASRLSAVTLVAREKAESDAQYYAYDSAGLRSRKLTRRLVGGRMVSEETISLGDLDIHRRRDDAGELLEEWRATRLSDAERRFVELLDWTVGAPPEGAPKRQDRYQLDTMIHSSTIELDGEGRLLSYEEYAPFGATVYAAGESYAEVSLKSRRYSGRERDQASGLYYYGARYYAPWLARWLSPDPVGDADGLNLYAFVGNEPVSHVDIGGFARTKQRGRTRTRQTRDKKLSDTPKAKAKIKRANKKTSSRKSATSSGQFTAPKRTGFNSRANRLKKKGTDLAHRTSFQAIRGIVLEAASKPPTQRDVAATVLEAIVGSDKELKKKIQNFRDNKSLEQSDVNELVKSLNSAEENLRPGHSSRNRRIKGRFDPGVKDSSTRKGRRSVSPVSRRQLTTALEKGSKIEFFSDDGENIVASTHDKGISVEDAKASLSQGSSFSIVTSVVGNTIVFQRKD
jgi:RHS repeat-associated protein